MDRDPANDLPFKPVQITHIEIKHAVAAAAPKPAAKPAAKKATGPEASFNLKAQVASVAAFRILRFSYESSKIFKEKYDSNPWNLRRLRYQRRHYCLPAV
jgi:hypothetical protein